MRLIMCVRLGQWPIDRLRRKQRPPHEPLVLVDHTHSRLLVAFACEKARAAGVCPGTTLAEALATCLGLAYANHDPQQDAQSLHRLACLMIRFSPTVAVEPPDALFLDVTGSERLFDGLDRLLRLVSDALTKLRVSHRAVIAPTAGAAWALASFGETNAIIAHGCLSSALAPLPIEALRLANETIVALHTVGVRTIQELLALPRSALPSRFGMSVLTRLDQALGQAAEPLAPVRPRQKIRAEMELDYALDSLEQLWKALGQLLQEVCRGLRRQGQGVKKLLLELVSANKNRLEREIHCSQATASPLTLFNLLRCASEGTKCDVGFVKITLSAPVSEALADEQLEFLEHEAYTAEKEFTYLVDRLRLRLGNDALRTSQLVASHLPERAFGLADATLNMSKRPKSTIESLPQKARPLHLLAMPIEVQCMASPASDGGGLPLFFLHENRSFEIIHARGPERICGLWWEGRNKTRDYFDVEENAGRRFWLFRVAETRKWYLHGIFDC